MQSCQNDMIILHEQNCENLNETDARETKDKQAAASKSARKNSLQKACVRLNAIRNTRKPKANLSDIKAKETPNQADIQARVDTHFLFDTAMHYLRGQVRSHVAQSHLQSLRQSIHNDSLCHRVECNHTTATVHALHCRPPLPGPTQVRKEQGERGH